MSQGELLGWARSHLECMRDTYLYGETNRCTAEAADQLRRAGYQHIAKLLGGLAWQKAHYPVAGVSAFWVRCDK